MSKRLRQLAFVIAGWHLYIAWSLYYAYDILSVAPSFRFIAVLPFGFAMWIAIYLITGLASFWALIIRSEHMIRGLGVISASLQGAWTVNFLLSFLFDERKQVSPLAVGLYGVIAIIEIYVLSIPTSPEWDAYVERRASRRASGQVGPDARPGQ